MNRRRPSARLDRPLVYRVLERILWAWAGAVSVASWRAEIHRHEAAGVAARVSEIEKMAKVDHELLRMVAKKVGIDPDAIERRLTSQAATDRRLAGGT